MTVQSGMILVMGIMFAGAIYMILERTLTRIMLGLVLFTNASNLLIIIMAGEAGLPPLVKPGVAADEYHDPLPQALTLTSIVISFAVTAFLLAMIYRSWQLARRDEIQIDVEDIRVAERPSFDAEDDAELVIEDSEFLTDEEDPNFDYEYTTEANPSVATQQAERVGTEPGSITQHTETAPDTESTSVREDIDTGQPDTRDRGN